jgi:long-chain acyl-CoA synthetase
MNDTNTLPSLLTRNASRWPHRPAWRHKHLGIWETQSWAAFARRCHDIARGLEANGFGHGDRLAVLGDNRPDLYAVLLAAHSLGGVGVPCDPDTDSSRLPEILKDARVSIAIADTVDQADRIVSVAAALPSPVRVLCVDTGSFNRHEMWEKSSLDALIEEGRGHGRCADGPPPLADLSGAADQGWGEGGLPKKSIGASSPLPTPLSQAEGKYSNAAPQDLALLLYSADAQSHPLLLSHAQLITAGERIADADPAYATDEAFCYLPMSCYEDTLYSLTLGLLCGFAGNCPEAPDTVLRDLREIGPTILFAPAVTCNALAQVVTSKAVAVTGFKRRSFRFFQHLALHAEACREQDQVVPVGVAIGCRIGELMAYAPVRDQLGLRRARWVHTDGRLPPDTGRLLRALGVALRPANVCATVLGPARETPETLHA